MKYYKALLFTPILFRTLIKCEKRNFSAKHLTEFETVFQTRSPQNRLHWIRNHAVPEKLRDGSILWSGYMENVTAQYEAEETAKQQSTLLDVIFESLSDQIYYMDRQSRLLGINPAGYKHHGYNSAEEMLGKTAIDLLPTPLGQQLFENEQRQMKTGEVTRVRERHDQEDGRVEYVESIKSPFKNKQGKPETHGK